MYDETFRIVDLPGFSIWSGSSHPDTHHYGKGQLAQHTLEVIELSLRNNNYFKTLNSGVDDIQLFFAALYHDLGKMDDYTPLPPENALIPGGRKAYQEWESTEHKSHIYHITRSGLHWSKNFDAHLSKFLPKEAHDTVLHAILAHHGRLEWKSPVTPQTKMAWILHLSDSLSARVNDVDKKSKKHYDNSPVRDMS